MKVNNCKQESYTKIIELTKIKTKTKLQYDGFFELLFLFLALFRQYKQYHNGLCSKVCHLRYLPHKNENLFLEDHQLATDNLRMYV